MADEQSIYQRRVAAPLLTGAATFGADVRDSLLAGAGFVAFVRSLTAYGMITHIDTAAARSAPGVRAVVTAADVPIHPVATMSPSIDIRYVQPLLASGVVRHVGEPIVAIVADTHAQALDAAELVVVDYDDRHPITDPYVSARSDPVFRDGELATVGPGAPAPGDGPWPTNVVTAVEVDSDPDAFAQGRVVELRVNDPRQSPCPIEPRVMSAAWEKGELWVWNATQKPHSFRDMLARLYDLDPMKVHVLAGPFVGGGFGGKTSRTVEEYLLPHLAHVTGAPVRWNETRSEYFLSSTQGRGEHIQVILAGGQDGRIQALSIDLLKDAGAYPGVGAVLPAAYSAVMAQGPYDIDHVEFTSRAVVTNLPPTSAYRGAGRASLVAALERAVDVYAGRIGIDPADVRRRNLVPADAMPYQSQGGGRYDNADYIGDLDAALAAVHYPERRAEQVAVRQDLSAPQIGIGIACYNHLTGGAGGENATVTVHNDGSATIVTGTTDQGHGHENTWSILASRVLGIPVDQITVVEGNTDAIAKGEGAVGSRSAQTAGIAVYRSATEAVDQGRHLAASVLEAAVADIVFDANGGTFAVAGSPSSAVGWAQVLSVAIDDEGARVDEVSCGDYFDPVDAVYPSGTHVAVVEVDPATGGVQVIEFVAVDDAGVRINPMIVEGQLHGGIASGIAHALGETMNYDEFGNPMTGTLMDYALAGADLFPSFSLHEATVRTDLNDLGIKAVGESGAIGATPAVHNAVLDALAPFGIEHLDLPLTPQRIWKAINAAAQ